MCGIKKIIPFVVFLFVVIVVSSIAYAKPAPKQCEIPDIRNDIRPNVGKGPTKVEIGIRMLDLSKIDDVGQSLTGDFALSVKWKDSRLAGLAGCEVPLKKIWHPGIIFMNSGRKFLTRPENVTIKSGGEVKYVQRYYGTFATYHKLENFPFDKHELKLTVIPAESSVDEVGFIVDENVTGRRDILNIPDWNVGDVKGEVTSMYTDMYDRYIPEYNFIIPAKRITNYYLLKVLLPLCLIVIMSWAVFWIDPSQFGAQIGLSATSMLTLIAFLFATSTMLPKLGYFTILDVFISGSTIIVFSALLESVLTSFLASNKRGSLSRKIDRISRLAFPVVYATFIIIIMFI